MIENQKRAWNHKQRLGQMELISLRKRDLRFERMDRFVADKSNSAACEARQFRARHELIARHQISDLVDRIAACFESPLVPVLDDSNFAPVALQNHARVHANERKTSRDIVLFGGLKKEAITAAVQFLES